MIIVRITGWISGTPPSAIPESLRQSLLNAGIEESDMDESLGRLLHGKFVDTYFDLAEHKAARAFMRDLHTFGLKSQLHDDKEKLFPSSSPRVLKYLLICLAGAILVSLLFVTGHLSLRVMSGFALLVLLLLFALAWTDLKRVTLRQQEKQRNFAFWIRIGLVALAILVRAVWKEPVLGFVILGLAIGGALFALIIRAINHETER